MTEEFDTDYIFIGTVIPERAQISTEFKCDMVHVYSDKPLFAHVNIILNHITVWISSNYSWDIFDLRNIVSYLVQGELSMIGYLRGYAYDTEITRVINKKREIDYVFGIGIPCLETSRQSTSIDRELPKLRELTTGKNGVLINRCLNDLKSAIKYADDTAFYCYRSIETLVNHCATLNDTQGRSKSSQWDMFREASQASKEHILTIKKYADPARHGNITEENDVDREYILTKTWEIVDPYVEYVINNR
ncbi:hypothetical protein [Kaistia adipata]|uniref:hypothetical protein n=1 Tax=Kaistia adipata TaxID=166954 RepID=UPI0012EBDE60|nr:hypothetical protein [Kaistia adipata]